jgi:hypothetical protein
MILYADNATEALSYAKKLVQFSDLNLTWKVSDYSLSFLDMTVYIDQVTGKIEHRPFRKARSHLERIPFVSHHPLDVRKGTFLSEMSRMAVLSSNPDNYVHALEDLQSIYIACGYPPGLISKWTKDNITKRWINRLRETSSDDRTAVNRPGVDTSDLLILKTVFNPIWDKFNIHELAEVVVDHWLSSLNNWGWYNKQLFAYVKETYSEISGNVSWGMAKKIAIRDGFFPQKDAEGMVEDLTPEVLDDLRRKAQNFVRKPPYKWEDISIENLRSLGHHTQQMEVLSFLDVQKVGLTTARWMLSCKKVRNFGDILSTVKRGLLVDNATDIHPQQDVNTQMLDLLRSPSPFLDDDVAMYDSFEYDTSMDAL